MKATESFGMALAHGYVISGAFVLRELLDSAIVFVGRAGGDYEGCGEGGAKGSEGRSAYFQWSGWRFSISSVPPFWGGTTRWMIQPYDVRRPYSNLPMVVPRESRENVSKPGCFRAFSHTRRMVVRSNGVPSTVTFVMCVSAICSSSTREFRADLLGIGTVKEADRVSRVTSSPPSYEIGAYSTIP